MTLQKADKEFARKMKQQAKRELKAQRCKDKEKRELLDGDDLELAKQMVNVNPILADAVAIRETKNIERKGGIA